MLKETSSQNDDKFFESICCDVRYQYTVRIWRSSQSVTGRFAGFGHACYEYESETGENLLKEEMLHYLEDDNYNQIIHYCKSDDVTPHLEKAITAMLAM